MWWLIAAIMAAFLFAYVWWSGQESAGSAVYMWAPSVGILALSLVRVSPHQRVDRATTITPRLNEPDPPTVGCDYYAGRLDRVVVERFYRWSKRRDGAAP